MASAQHESQVFYLHPLTSPPFSFPHVLYSPSSPSLLSFTLLHQDSLCTLLSFNLLDLDSFLMIHQQMLDFVEARNFNEFYGKFVRLVLPVSHYDFMRPRTTAHKVQSYLYSTNDDVTTRTHATCTSSLIPRKFIALAYIARISGAAAISQKYISQARVLSGSIYDTPDVNSSMLSFRLLSSPSISLLPLPSPLFPSSLLPCILIRILIFIL